MKKPFLLITCCALFQICFSQYNPTPCGTPMLISTGTLAVSGDDNIAEVVLPFSFTFYGSDYSSIFVSTNGFISFDNFASNGCCSGYTLPNTDATYIAIAHTDLYVPSGTPGDDGSVFYDVTGTAPFRTFVVHYQSAFNCCGSTPFLTGEIQLFETSNEIKIVTGSVNSTRETTMGLAKGDGISSSVVENRNSVSFSAGNECWSLMNNSTLPLTLTKFSGRKSGNSSNYLEWITSEEQNTLLFDIQRSTNGVDFSTIASQPAAGISSSNQSYNFTDFFNTERAEIYFYRLKMVDNNRVFKYSPVVKIHAGNSGFNAEVSPNPFVSFFIVNIESQKQQDATLTLTDMNGRKIAESAHQLSSGNNAIRMNVPTAGKGTYILKISSPEGGNTFKMVKQ
ncbi:MAG: T9SS type A sorting domain-containing protein [Chitinophagaceae bacterium]